MIARAFASKLRYETVHEKTQFYCALFLHYSGGSEHLLCAK